MKLKKGNRIIDLIGEAQIAAYLRAGYEEVKEVPKKEPAVEGK